MPFTYTYSISADVISGKVNAGLLHTEIVNSSIDGTKLVGVDTMDDVLDIIFEPDITAAEKTTLDGDTTGPAGGLVGNHSGLDFSTPVEEPVLDKDLTTPPAHVKGARYIVGVGATGDWAGKDNDIATSTGTVWIFSDPTDGTVVWVEDEDLYYVFAVATAWDRLQGNFGTGAGTFCEGNDSRLSDDRTASGIRTATTVVSVSGATAPVSGQVLRATSGTAATWQTISGGSGLATKAGTVAAGSFAGNPKTATVTFGAAFSDAGYAVTLMAVTTGNKSFAPAVETQLAGSFVIMLGSNSTANLTQVNWIAVKTGET